MVSRTTAKISEPVTLFMVGIQCRSLFSMWKVPPIARKMGQLQKELVSNQNSGLLWGETFLSFRPHFTTLYLSYWKSPEHIKIFANDKVFSHRQAWTDYAKKYYNDKDLGVWHETYEIDPKKYENIYVGMSPFGMSGFAKTVDINQSNATFEKRLSP